MPLYGTLIYKTVFSIVRASLWKSQKDPTKQSFKIYKWNSMLYRKCHISKNSENWNGQREKIRSSRPKVFCKKCVLRIFTKFTGKHLCQSLFLIKLRPQACSFIKKRLWHSYFPVNFMKFLRTPFYIEHLWWLLLSNVECNTEIRF